MRIIKLDEVVNFDIDISGIVCSNQVWSNKYNSFSYLDFPRPCGGLIYICEGSAIYHTAVGKTITAEASDILYLPKNSRYFVKFVPADSKSMLLNFNITHKGAETAFADEIAFITHDENRILYELFESLCGKYAKSTNKLIIKSMFYKLVSELAFINSDIESDTSLSMAIEYINNHLNTLTNIAELAKMCAMSESTFRRTFSNIMGKSPKKYINEKKIEKAKKLLETSELSIGGICDTLGFYDCAYFVKLFKQQTSQTPTSYRKAKLAERRYTD